MTRETAPGEARTQALEDAVWAKLSASMPSKNLDDAHYRRVCRDIIALVREADERTCWPEPLRLKVLDLLRYSADSLHDPLQRVLVMEKIEAEAVRAALSEDGQPPKVERLTAALRHVADEIRGQVESGILSPEHTSLDTRMYWSQVEGVAREALRSVGPTPDLIRFAEALQEIVRVAANTPDLTAWHAGEMALIARKALRAGQPIEGPTPAVERPTEPSHTEHCATRTALCTCFAATREALRSVGGDTRR